MPLHLADSALIDLVRPGDVVDVLAAPATEGRTAPTPPRKVVATDAIVVLVSAKEKAQAADSDRVVLVALPAAWPMRWPASALVPDRDAHPALSALGRRRTARWHSNLSSLGNGRLQCSNSGRGVLSPGNTVDPTTLLNVPVGHHDRRRRWS